MSTAGARPDRCAAPEPEAVRPAIPPGVELHPWNHGFTWRDSHRRGGLGDDALARFDRFGYVVLDEVFDAGQVAGIVDEIDRHQERVLAYLRRLPGGRLGDSEIGSITFSQHVVARSDRLRPVVATEILLDACRAFVGPDADLFWDQGVYKRPETPRPFPWHQDNGYTYLRPQQFLTCWIALTDATVENGCLWVVPGLHRLGTLRHRRVAPIGVTCLADPEPAGATAVPLRRGDVVAFSSLLPHASGPNTTGTVRKALIAEFTPAGAHLLVGDPSGGPPLDEVLVERQAPWRFPVLRDGVGAGPDHPGRPGPVPDTRSARGRSGNGTN